MYCILYFKGLLAKQESEEVVQGAVAVQVGRCGGEGLADPVKIQLAASSTVLCVSNFGFSQLYGFW